MNKTLKIILTIINIIVLYFAYKWYQEKDEYEPIIVILGQVVTILTVIFEKDISRNILRKIKDSTIDLDKNSSSNIQNVKRSNIKIK